MRSARVELILDTLRAVRGARDLSKATDDVADSLASTAREGELAGRAVDEAGDNMSQAARAAEHLDREIEQLTRSMREMAVTQALTGENFSKQIRQQESDVRRLTRNRKLLGDFGAQSGAESGAEAAAGFAARFSQRVGPLVADLPIGPIAAGAGVLGAALAPSIAAGIGAGLSSGVALSAIAGGIALLAKDPQIQNAAKQLGNNLLGGLTREAQTFRQPVLDSIAQIEAASTRLVPKIGQVFRNTSPLVAGFTDDVLKAADALLDSFVVATAHSGPPMQALGQLITGTSTAVGNMISTLSRNSAAGASAISDLTDSMVSLINTTTAVLDGLAHVKSGLDSFDHGIDSVRYGIEDFTKKLSGGKHMLDWTADGYKAGSEAAELYRKGLIGAAGSANDYKHYLQGAGKSTNDLAAATADAAGQSDLFNKVLRRGVVDADDVKEAEKSLADAQKGLSTTLEQMGGGMSVAGLRANSLKTAMDNLYGATIRQADANEAFQASWDGLSAAVKTNKHTLDIHTAAGRANRDALKALIGSTNDLFIADVAAGASIAAATKKHQARIVAVKEEARRVGLNKVATQDLINTYGRIPKKKETDLLLSGVNAIAKTLRDLYVFQRALADGIPIGSEIAKLKGNKGRDDLRELGHFHADGGWTGPGPKYQPAGVVHADEFVVQKSSRRKVEASHPGLLDHVNLTGALPAGYSGGGTVAPVDTSTRWPFHVSVGATRVMSRSQAASKVTPAFGGWPAGPGAQRGDSGVWRKIVALVNGSGIPHHFGNAYRPGDPLWHGSGRAVDWMGFNQDRLAHFFLARQSKILEMIHRTGTRDYAYTRGRNMGSFNNALMEAHRNHLHIAMANGGVLREPVFGYGARSGASYSLAEYGPERVTPMRGGRSGGTTQINITFSGPVGSRYELQTWLTGAIDDLKAKGRI